MELVARGFDWQNTLPLLHPKLTCPISLLIVVDMSNVCPLCPFKACANSKTIRSDGLRRHVQNVHKVPTVDYVDAAGSSVQLVTPTLVVKKKVNGRYGNGYCLACGCYIKCTMNYANEDWLAILKKHQCKPKQARGPKKPSTGTKPVVSAPVSSVTTPMPVVSLVSVVDRLKKYKALMSLDLEGLVKARLREVERSQEPPSEDEGYEDSDGEMVYDDEPKVHTIEEYDEIHDIIMPLLVSYSKTIPQREAQSKTISNKNMEIMQLEDKLEFAKNESAREIKDMKERLMALSRQVSEETTLRHAAEARLKLLQSAAPAPGPDTIRHLGGSNPEQWILQYQG